MKITNADAKYYKWPRRAPVSNGLHTWTDIQMCLVTVVTDDGVTGIGVGSASPGERQLREHFCSLIAGMDPTLTEHIWSKLADTKMYGRRGLETAALSPIDMALWDIKAKLANLPVHRLVGGYRDRVPVYIAGGYYGRDKPVIVGAHVIVACPERHFEVEVILDMRHPFDQRWGYNGDVVKLQHVRRTPMPLRESI